VQSGGKRKGGRERVFNSWRWATCSERGHFSISQKKGKLGGGTLREGLIIKYRKNQPFGKDPDLPNRGVEELERADA